MNTNEPRSSAGHIARLAGALVFALALSVQPCSPSAGSQLFAQQPPQQEDTTLIGHAAARARARFAELVADPRDAGTNLHHNALTDLTRGEYEDAIRSLIGAMLRAPRSAMYHGDFAYVLARTSMLDSAATEYTRAFQLQPQNAWYLVGLAIVRAAQERWPQAAGALEQAREADSNAVDARVAQAGGAYFEQAGDRGRAMDWYRLAIRRDSTDVQTMLRLAALLRNHNDTSGISVIRRYLRLRPDDRLGQAIYATFLYDVGQTDSALAVAEATAADTAYREYAAEVFLQVGVRMLRSRDIARSIRVLERGQPWAAPALRPQFSFYLGSAQLVRVSSVLNSIEESRSCDSARVADSLAIRAEQNLRDGSAVDTTRSRMYLSDVLPGFRRNAADHVQSLCRPGRQPTPPPPRRRP